MVELSVLVPAYRAENTIIKAVKTLVEVLDKEGFAFEIIVIIDGTVDKSEQLLIDESITNVRIISYLENCGKGYALRQGVKAAKGDFIGMIDADLDLSPNGLIAALTLLKQDVTLSGAIGSKYHAESIATYPRFRRFQSKLYSQLVRRMFDLPISDTQTGLKVFKNSAIKSVINDCSLNGFAFDLELVVSLNQKNFRLIESPIELDFQFDSTVRLLDAFSVLRDTLIVWRRHLRRVV